MSAARQDQAMGEVVWRRSDGNAVVMRGTDGLFYAWESHAGNAPSLWTWRTAHTTKRSAIVSIVGFTGEPG